MAKVLVVEDDIALRGVLLRGLREEGFEAVGVGTGAELLDRIEPEGPNLLIVDIGLPDADGRDICQALRAQGVRAPVLFLTARDALPDRLSGFHAGGDDYLTKPFDLKELLVRVRALLRRSDAPDQPANGLFLDADAHAVVHDGQPVRLTPTEYRLIEALVATPGEVVRRSALVAAGWPDGALVHDNTLDAYFARIRRKLRDAGAPQAIETARGVGYVLR